MFVPEAEASNRIPEIDKTTAKKEMDRIRRFKPNAWNTAKKNSVRASKEVTIQPPHNVLASS